MSWHLMWWSCHLIRCDCLCCVMSRDAMRCHVMCAHAILLCPTKNYSSTTLYYTVLPCTTKYNSSTTLYYKLLLQYYSVLQTSQDKFTKYCACHAKWIPWLIRITHETLFTISGATRVTLQLHQILRLPRKMNLMIDPPHKWNVIYNARSNKSHPVTSANIAPATQNDSYDWSASHIKRHLECAEQQDSASTFTKNCACHAKWISWLIRLTYETSFRMRGATRLTLHLHQILHLPRKMNLMIDPPHIWNVI